MSFRHSIRPVWSVLALIALMVLLAACDVNVNGGATPTPTTSAITAIPLTTPSEAPTDVTAVPSDTVPAATDTSLPVDTATAVPTEPTATPVAVANTPTTVPATAVPATAVPMTTATGTVIDAAVAMTAQPTPADDVPSPTAVTSVSTGSPVTALAALQTLKSRALEALPDARLALLVNARPGQQKSLLGSALGDPSINEPTPGGKGNNWTLVAISTSRNAAMAFSLDGTTTDLVKEGGVTGDMLAHFGGPSLAAIDLTAIDPAKLKDSDAIAQSAGDKGAGNNIGVALLAPDGLGLGPLPTPSTGGNSPQIAYELFSTDPNAQMFEFFDAQTGALVLNSAP